MEYYEFVAYLLLTSKMSSSETWTKNHKSISKYEIYIEKIAYLFRTSSVWIIDIGLCSSVNPSMDTLTWKLLSNISSEKWIFSLFFLNKCTNVHCIVLPSLLSVVISAINHNCWLYVPSAGLLMLNGPPCNVLWFPINDVPRCIDVNVIGGPKYESTINILISYLKNIFLITC